MNTVPTTVAATHGGRLKIAVLMGGKSIEREVSFNSGRTVCDHLDASLYDVLPLFQDETGLLYFLPWHFLHRGKITDFRERLLREVTPISWDELKNQVDFVYIAVHGRYAEDGTLQGMLEVLEIPYLGGKVLGSALGMDKAAQKELLASQGIDVPRGFVVSAKHLATVTTEELIARMAGALLEFPLIVKPSHEGSSLGVSVVRSAAELLSSVLFAGHVDADLAQDVLVEEKVEGMEFVCVSLEKVNPANIRERSWFSFPLTEVVIETGTDFFDYEQKYMPGRADKITPARCTDQVRDRVMAACERVAQVLHFETLARTDGIVAADGRVVIIDPNTLTGMGPSTFLFHQAAEFGLSHAQLINALIETELIKYGMHVKHQAKDAVMTTEAKKRIVVLLGGDTNERETSLESGRNVCYKLSPTRYEVIPVFVGEHMALYKLDQRLLIKNSTRGITAQVGKEQQILWSDLPALADFVFIALHGGRGENGAIQGALEMMDLPYNGPGVLASALCMDKFETNSVLRAKGFQVPSSLLVEQAVIEVLEPSAQDVYLAAQMKQCNLEFPLIVKPHDDGCSVFVSKVHDTASLLAAMHEMFARGKNTAMIEELIEGMELTVGVLGNDDPVALPPSRAVAKGGVLSMAEKFLPGDGENQTPAPLPAEVLQFVQKTVKDAFIALGCIGYSRIDCFYQTAEQSPTGQQRVVLLEVNTLPALTPATCFFHQAAEVGFKPMDVIDRIVELGFAQHGKAVTITRQREVEKKSDIQANLF